MPPNPELKFLPSTRTCVPPEAYPRLGVILSTIGVAYNFTLTLPCKFSFLTVSVVKLIVTWTYMKHGNFLQCRSLGLMGQTSSEFDM